MACKGNLLIHLLIDKTTLVILISMFLYGMFFSHEQVNPITTFSFACVLINASCLETHTNEITVFSKHDHQRFLGVKITRPLGKERKRDGKTTPSFIIKVDFFIFLNISSCWGSTSE